MQLFHRRIDELFDRRRRTVDFINEQHAAVTGIRQIRQQITSVQLQRGACGNFAIPSRVRENPVASVVLPSPGGPSRSKWLTVPCVSLWLREGCRRSTTAICPTTSSSFDGRNSSSKHDSDLQNFRTCAAAKTRANRLGSFIFIVRIVVFRAMLEFSFQSLRKTSSCDLELTSIRPDSTRL